MGVLKILIVSFAVIITLIIFTQPIWLLNEEARESLNSSGTTVKYGTDSEGNIVEVGPSSALPDITTVLLWLIPLSIVIGWIVWVIRFGRGGEYEY